MKNRPLLYTCLVILAFIMLAVLCGEGRIIKELKPSSLEQTVPQDGTVTVWGQVYRIEEKTEYQALFLKDNSIQYQSQSFQEAKIIVYTDSEIKIHIGNKVRAEGKVSFFQGARNPGNFDQKRYYQIQNIRGRVWAEETDIADPDVWKWRMKLTDIRQKWREMLVDIMGEEDGNTMSAMLLGEKDEMDQELKTLYQVNGIGHIIAISGLHLSFIGIGMYKILRRITGSYPVGGAFGILFLMLYILMIGLTVSAVRALVMFLFRVGADMTGRHYDAPTALAAAAVVVLLWRPLSLYDGGFWMSFGAVFAVLAVLPVLQENIEGLQKSVVRGIVQGMTASIGINLIILPILLYYFFEFPLYSFILNLFVIPLMSVLLFLGMTGSFLCLWVEALSQLIFRLCRMILWIYKGSCNIAIGLPGARLVIGKPELWQIVVYYGILALVLYLFKSYQKYEKYQNHENFQNCGNYQNCERYKNCESYQGSQIRHFQSGLKKMICRESEREKILKLKWKKRLTILLWVVGLFVLVFRWGENEKLTTVVLDVGQGDGIFIKGPNGGTYLVDGGSSDVKKVGRYRLEPFLKSQGVGVLDYVLISHGDSDHMNGVEELIERQDIGVKIRMLVLPMQEVWDEALAGLAEKARSSGIRVVTIGADQSIQEGKMTITCIQPGNTDRETASGTKLPSGNAASMVLAVQYGKFDMLLTGDVEEEGEEQLIKRLEEQYWNCAWEVLKVAHHGSKNSSTEEFLVQVQPAYALVSAGQENRYGHPHQETIGRLVDAGSKIYSTQKNGAIIVEVEGGRTLKIEKILNIS